MKNQRGDIADFLLIVMVAVLFSLFIVPLFENSKLFDKWQGDCRIQDGLVVKVSDNRYECYINGKLTTLKGYEGK